MRLRSTAMLLLAILVIAIYLPVATHDFVLFDDDQYIFENPRIQGGLTLDGVRWAFTTFHTGNWHPLTWLSHLVDVQFFGLWPGGHLLVNLLLHLANTLLLFLLLRAMTGCFWRSWVVAALFAVHPIHVESVAWVSERKDVLSTFLWLLTMGAYLRYVRLPAIARYTAVAVSLSLGLMAKPMLVTLPLVLLLLDIWPLGRLSLPGARGHEGGTPAGSLTPARAIREKLPLLLLAAASGIVTLLAQRSADTVAPLHAYPPEMRLANAALAATGYLGKLFWPADLAAFYPHPVNRTSVPLAIAAACALLIISGLMYRATRRLGYPATGWGWYLVTLAPVIGIIQVGGQAMADRYLYVPSIGIFLLAVWTIGDLGARKRWGRLILAPVVAAVLGCSMVLAFIQVGYWKDTETLMEHSMKVTKDNFKAALILGLFRHRQGRLDEAIPSYREVLRIWPTNSVALSNLALALSRQGDTREAIATYRMLLQAQPFDTQAHLYLAELLDTSGDPAGAIEHYRAAVELDPKRAEGYYGLADGLFAQGAASEAAATLRSYIALAPDDFLARYNLGKVLDALGQRNEAMEQYRQAIARAPRFAPAHNNLGVALAQGGDIEGAVVEFREAVRDDPQNPEASRNLQQALLIRGE